jgi:tRNA(Ile)-lysidine synthase
VPPPSTEADARDVRYRFLLETKEKEATDWVLTGHHADDQAETVLFRVLRGTGLRGLGGIPAERGPGVYRPLLPFSRAELMDFARRMRIPFRQDPSNWDLNNPRNFLRHQILPRLDRGPIPAVRSALLRLGRLSRENEEAWSSLLPALLGGVLGEESSEPFIVRKALLAYHPAVQTRLLREIFRSWGIHLDEVGTRAALEFTRTGASGRFLSLPGGLHLVREFDRFRLGDPEGQTHGEPLEVEDPGPGSGSFEAGGHSFLAVWGPEEMEDCEKRVAIPITGTEFPLLVRGWEVGDRIQLPYGAKKLKKLFAEARIPPKARGRTPVLVDALGRVLWVAGLATSSLIRAGGGTGVFFFGIRNVDKS